MYSPLILIRWWWWHPWPIMWAPKFSTSARWLLFVQRLCWQVGHRSTAGDDGHKPDAVGGLVDQKHLNHLVDCSLLQVNEDYNPCADWWKNMKDDITKKIWAIFDKTGIFLTLCCHGFLLVIADMVQSGELYVSFLLLFLLLMYAYSVKYPWVCVEKLLDAFSEDIGSGFNIGCKFKTTLNNSPLGPRARQLRHTCLVGAFHGHAHNRLCQLSHLATYVKGLGLEDLEGCERAFLKSNALAASLWYASIFYWMQAIATYFEHNNTFIRGVSKPQ